MAADDDVMRDTESMLSMLLDVERQLRRDDGVDRTVLRRRDREIGRSVGVDAVGKTHPIDRLGVWLVGLGELSGDGDGGGGVGVGHAGGVGGVGGVGGDDVVGGVALALRWVSWVLVVLGLCVGVGMVGGVFFYDGSRPVNVAVVLAVFVALQAVLVLLTVLVMLPGGYVPVLGRVQAMISMVSPGRWSAVILRMLPQRHRDAVASGIGLGVGYQKRFGRLQKWMMLRWSGGFAVGFHVGAIGMAMWLVTFTDLAFGWSTTLDVDAGALHRIVHVMSWPWVGWLGDAVPGEALVDQTQYFRTDRGRTVIGLDGVGGDGRGEFVMAFNPGIARRWWPFVLMSMLVYGLLPRVVMLVFVSLRARLAVRDAIVHMPGVADVLDRLSSRLVETGAVDGDGMGELGDGVGMVLSRKRPEGNGKDVEGRRGVVFNWSGVPMSDEQLLGVVGVELGLDRVGVRAVGVVEAGADERMVGELLGSESANKKRVGLVAVLVVKSWEPPVLDLLDFVEILRECMGDRGEIVVMLIGMDGVLDVNGVGNVGEVGGAKLQAAVGKDVIESWRGKLATLGDGYVSVHGVGGELGDE